MVTGLGLRARPDPDAAQGTGVSTAFQWGYVDPGTGALAVSDARIAHD